MKAEQSSTNTEQGDSSGRSSPSELITKHPLQNQWQLWYFRPDKKNSDWLSNLMDLTTFDTVEDFWSIYNHIELASNLSVGSDYSVFKNGIKPMWEDTQNKNGGRWLFSFSKNNKIGSKCDQLWLEVLLCLIGEAFGDYSDLVCGATINIRNRMDKISVWTKDRWNKEANLQIGKTLKERTGYQGTIVYEAHEDTQHKTSSVARSTWTL